MVNYSQINQEVFQVHNQVRQNPQFLIPYLEKKLSSFKGNNILQADGVWLQTNEGPAAVKELIEFLKHQQALQPLQWSDELSQACQDHVNDTGPKGMTGHNGSDGSQLSDRIERYGKWQSMIAENCDYGNCTGLDIIMNLAIDDGVSSRGHRTNIFNPSAKLVGIASGMHTEYDHCCVLDYAGGLSTGNNPINNHHQQHYAPVQTSNCNQQSNHYDDAVPPGCVSTETNTKTSISNGVKTITTTTKYTMKDGSTKTVTKTQTISNH